MEFFCRHLVVTLLLLNGVFLAKLTESAEESTLTTVAYVADEELGNDNGSNNENNQDESDLTTIASPENEGLENDNGDNNANNPDNNANNPDNNVDSTSNVEGETMKTEALYHPHSSSKINHINDEYGYDYSGNRSWNGPKKWRVLPERRDYNDYIYGRYRYQPWPLSENRWDTPQYDEWNFRASNGDKCNKVSRNDIPDQPYRRFLYQAYYVPGKEFKDFNVSSYDVYQERCCQGKTYPKYPNGQYSCCGSSDYDTTREICCDEKLHTIQLGYECCGDKYINIDAEICCYHPTNGIVAKPLPEGALGSKENRLFSQCCGDELYDTRTHVCFLLTSRIYEPADFTIIEKKYNRTGCCEGKPYDQDAERCNETAKTYTFLSGPPCVFKQAYEQVQRQLNRNQASIERRRYLMQRRDIHYSTFRGLKYDRLLLCRDKQYNPFSQLCCGDRDYKVENGSVKIWNRTLGSRCCGTEIHNYYTHRCCNGRVIPNLSNDYYMQGCCGEALYDRRKQWCCKGSNTIIDSNRDKGDSCCGSDGLVFNSRTHACCNNRLVEIPEALLQGRFAVWSCCPSSEPNQPDQVYNRYSAKCCDGIVYNISGSSRWRYQCCGDKMYNTGNSTCCGGKLEDRTSCCADKETFNYATHRCCEGNVIKKPSTYASKCCGKVLYDSSLQTCCFDSKTSAWQLTSKKSRYERCCAGKPYDPDAQACCGSSIVIEDKEKQLCCNWVDPKTGTYSSAVVEKKANAEFSSCCGLTAYDRQKEICCNGNVIATVNATTRCCGSNAYNKDSDLCCEGEVHDKSDNDFKICCGKNVYDVTKEICCHGVALPVKDVNTAMCCYDKSPDDQNALRYF